MNDDLISRSALLAEYDRVHVGAPGGARKLMQDAPTIDAVPVVRCKDCKNYAFDGIYYHCKEMGFYSNNRERNEFCSYGERKENIQ